MTLQVANCDSISSAFPHWPCQVFAAFFGHNRLMLTENTTMKRGDLPAVLNLGERKTRDFLNDMTEYIRFNKSGIYISDSFVYRGEKKERKYNNKMKLFNKSVQSLYKGLKPTKHKYFGFIVQLLPFVNRKYNIICSNPEDKK